MKLFYENYLLFYDSLPYFVKQTIENKKFK